MRSQTSRTLALAGLMLATFAGPALAQSMNFKADLKGSEEVPPVNTQGSGSLTATYDAGTKRLDWRGNVSGLSGPATAAHFHGPAERGKNAGVLVPVQGVEKGNFEGSATLTDDQARALTSEQMYFNVHTAANPPGEIRGQVTKQ